MGWRGRTEEAWDLPGRPAVFSYPEKTAASRGRRGDREGCDRAAVPDREVSGLERNLFGCSYLPLCFIRSAFEAVHTFNYPGLSSVSMHCASWAGAAGG